MPALALAPRKRMRTRLLHYVQAAERAIEGGGGVKLWIYETGPENAPAILFVHGFSQSGRCWIAQMQSLLAQKFRLVAFDLRGHGQSGKPEADSAYTYDRLWAEDVAAVIDAARLRRPVLAGWSYGGLVIADYLRHFGFDHIAGVSLIGGISRIGGPATATVGPEFLALLADLNSPDLDAFARASQRLSELCVARPIAQSWASILAGQTARVPIHVRRALFARRLDNDDVLRRLSMPVLIAHGDCDRVVLVAEARRHSAIIPRAKQAIYRGVGHSPFMEAPERFNRELAAFTMACRG